MEVVEKVVEIQSWHNINILSRNCLKWLILSDSGSEGWGFESLRAYQNKKSGNACYIKCFLTFSILYIRIIKT